MRFIPSKLHGILDYLAGVILILIPWINGFGDGGPAQMVLVTAGILIIVMSLLTDYEYGFFKVIPMEIHLVTDALLGMFLMMSPWLFDFSYVSLGPHLLFGFLLIVAALFTKVKQSIIIIIK
ncbi:MAG: hypothetical protein ACFCUM_00820 [Bacteroidales bacterium]